MPRKILEPDEKPLEREPSTSCPRTDCKENLFGYCQTSPDLERVNGKPNLLTCKTFRVRS
jgi:hypothetical protein